MSEKLVLWDCDNTLMASHSVFDNIITNVIRLLDNSDSGHGQTRDKFDLHLRESRISHFVDPNNIWSFTLNRLKKDMGFSGKSYTEALNMLMSIYTILPELYPDVHLVLESVKKLGFHQGLVTHAEPGWTDFKLRGHSLDTYFPNPFIVDVRGPKSSQSWIDAWKYYGSPQLSKTWVVGDNIKDDIGAAFEAGILNVIYLNLEDGWSVTKEGDVPTEAHVATSLLGVLEILKSSG